MQYSQAKLAHEKVKLFHFSENAALDLRQVDEAINARPTDHVHATVLLLPGDLPWFSDQNNPANVNLCETLKQRLNGRIRFVVCHRAGHAGGWTDYREHPETIFGEFLEAPATVEEWDGFNPSIPDPTWADIESLIQDPEGTARDDQPPCSTCSTCSFGSLRVFGSPLFLVICVVCVVVFCHWCPFPIPREKAKLSQRKDGLDEENQTLSKEAKRLDEEEQAVAMKQKANEKQSKRLHQDMKMIDEKNQTLAEKAVRIDEEQQAVVVKRKANEEESGRLRLRKHRLDKENQTLAEKARQIDKEEHDIVVGRDENEKERKRLQDMKHALDQRNKTLSESSSGWL